MDVSYNWYSWANLALVLGMFCCWFALVWIGSGKKK
jgi:hypothetical protein